MKDDGFNVFYSLLLGRLKAGGTLGVLQRDCLWLADDHLAVACAHVARAEVADVEFDPPEAVIVSKSVDLSND